MGSDSIHAVGEGRLGCEASGPPRGATWVTQTQTRFIFVYFGKYVVVLNGYSLFCLDIVLRKASTKKFLWPSDTVSVGGVSFFVFFTARHFVL